MRIVYDVKWSLKDVLRMDAIVIDRSEFPARPEGWVYAFRGDDRKPSEIFKSGFKKRTPRLQLKGAAIESSEAEAPLSWSAAVGHTERPLSALGDRTTTYTLRESEVVFRPNHFDLLKETCVSLTRDFNLCVGFPLDDGTTTYSYIVRLPERVLPTFEVQKRSPNKTLHESMEVTCNEVNSENVVGAAEITRTKKGGDGAMSTVEFEIKAWYWNFGGEAVQSNTDGLASLIEEETGKSVLVSGRKAVIAGVKHEGACVLPNNVLAEALKALLGKTAPIGGITMDADVPRGSDKATGQTGKKKFATDW